MSKILIVLSVWVFWATLSKAQNQNLDSGTYSNEDYPYQVVRTFVNPVMPGDHPDLTLLKVGNDFYSCGSNFHFTPYLPILHSTDLVHWREICRVVPPTWSGLISDAPQAGTWGGAITYFYDS